MWYVLITITFIFNGMIMLAGKYVSICGYSQSKSIYLFCYFSTALVLSIITLSIRKQLPELKALMLGILMGLFWLGASASIVTALSFIPATKFLPVFCCGNILCTFILSYVLWRERIKTIYGWVGIVLAIISIVLVMT